MGSRFSLEANLSLIDGFTGPLKKISGTATAFGNKFSTGMGKVNASLDRMQTRMANMSKEMAPVAMAGTGMVIAGQQIAGAGKSILNSFGAIVQEGQTFEKTMSDVAAVARVDKASKAFKDLEETAMQLGASTQFTAQQVGEGMTFLAMAGFDANQQIAAMPDMLKLAQVGNIDLATAADIASNTLGAFKMEASEMNRVANVMSATMTRSNVNMAMLADTFKYAAPIANAVGVSIEDLAAMTGLLGDVGIQGSQAGTALRAAMVRLAKPPAMAADALQSLGVATMDAQGNLRNMPQILEDIRKATEVMGTGKRLEAISEIFGTEASAAFAELISKADASGKSISGFAESIKLAAQADELSEVARNMADNVDGASKAFGSATSAIKISVFNSFKDVLKNIYQWGAKVALSIYEWTKRHQTLTKIISVSVAIIGGLLVAFGTLLMIAGSIAGAFVMMSIAAAAFGVTLSAAIWPVTLVVAAIIAAIAVVALLITYWEELMNFFRGTPGIIQAVLAVMFPFITIPLMIAANWDYLVEIIKSAWQWITNTILSIGEWFNSLSSWVKIAIGLFMPFISIPYVLYQAWVWAYDKISGIISSIGENAASVSAFFGFDKWKKNDVKPTPKSSTQNTSSPANSFMERLNREQVDINVKAPPGTTAERNGKKSPGVSLNMGTNGACA
jgi:TP901 family phage tail tape measure protein